MDSVAISEDSLEHSEHGTQNATQCPGFHPGSSSDATTWQLLLRLHTGLAHLRHRCFVFSLEFQQANRDIIEHQKTAPSDKL